MEISEILQRVDELKGEIDALRPISPEQEQRIMQKFRLDWTFHSNAIEGNSLTYGETRALLLYGVTAQGKPLKDALDIKGHHEALDYLVAFVQQKQALTEAHIREIHKIILSEPYEMEARTPDGRSSKRRIAVGQYKTMPNHVETQTGKTHYYATPEETPARMGDLMAWYRRERDKLHPLILAGTFHYEFVAIHPFDDGNGRMARLLMNLILMQAGYPPVVVRIDGRPEYYLALAQADAGELDNFITLIGNLLIHSLELFLRGAKGENIDELEDLDKKLTLLQRKLETQSSEIPVKSPKTLTKWVDSFLQPFLVQLFAQLAKFDRFFTKTHLEMSYSEEEWTNIHSGANLNLEQFIDDFRDSITERNISHIVFISKWELFIADSDFSLSSTLRFYLDRHEFMITHLVEPFDKSKLNTSLKLMSENPLMLMKKRLLLKHSYEMTQPLEELNKLVQNITNYILDVINQKADN